MIDAGWAIGVGFLFTQIAILWGARAIADAIRETKDHDERRLLQDFALTGFALLCGFPSPECRHSIEPVTIGDCTLYLGAGEGFCHHCPNVRFGVHRYRYVVSRIMSANAVPKPHGGIGGVVRQLLRIRRRALVSHGWPVSFRYKEHSDYHRACALSSRKQGTK